MIRQHDTAGADSDLLGLSRYLTNQYRGGGAGNTCHIVVFRQPQTFEPQLIRMAGVFQHVLKGLGNI